VHSKRRAIFTVAIIALTEWLCGLFVEDSESDWETRFLGAARFIRKSAVVSLHFDIDCRSRPFQ
jgi:hypothetical protein